jgi:hypothetical protein
MSCRVTPQWIFPNHMFTYLWNYICENLVVKSVGLNHFSLLGSASSSSSVDESSFGCVVILSLYLTLNFVNFFSNCCYLKSVCNTLLDIYHRAFTIAGRALFWYLCNISIFKLQAVPQRGVPYVQMGFWIVLYISNLFSIDNSDFQYICWKFSPSRFHMESMWVLAVFC